MLPATHFQFHTFPSSSSSSSSFLFSIPLPTTLSTSRTPKSKSLIRSSAPDTQATLPSSAIQRIADKLRSLGITEQPTTSAATASAGEIFVPLPHHLPKQRVGHTIDSSWSTPENPVPEPGTGTVLLRQNEIVEEQEEQRRRRKREEVATERERAPTLAELSLSDAEMRRLTTLGLGMKQKLKVGKAGITEGIVNGIHERWRRYEVVRIVCEDICRINMKRTHDLLEVKVYCVNQNKILECF